MARDLIDLLWRDHPDAPKGGARGPRSKVTTSQAIDAAITLADAAGIDAVTVRRLAGDLGISAMALYTHVGSRDDLLVLMADTVDARATRTPCPVDDWRARVRRAAEDELARYTAHWWLLDISDPRTSFGPGTIEKYDHDLHTFDGSGLGDVERDAAWTFVADFVRASAHSRRPHPGSTDMAAAWSDWQPRLAAYLGDDCALAQRVGAAAGEVMNTSYNPEHAWTFGLERVLDALTSLVDEGRA